MTPDPPRLLAVVVTYQSAAIVGDCLRAIPAALGKTTTGVPPWPYVHMWTLRWRWVLGRRR